MLTYIQNLTLIQKKNINKRGKTIWNSNIKNIKIFKKKLHLSVEQKV